jgi:hypothetical protein
MPLTIAEVHPLTRLAISASEIPYFRLIEEISTKQNALYESTSPKLWDPSDHWRDGENSAFRYVKNIKMADLMSMEKKTRRRTV